MDFVTVFLVGLFTAFVYAYWRAIRTSQYWTERGICQVKGLPFFGSLLPVILRRKALGDVLKEIYEAYPLEKVIGFYFFMKPSLLMRDVDMIERVMIKDFAHFTDRGTQPDVNSEPLLLNLFSTNGNLWRAVRTKFSPMFTTGKLRFMFPQVAGISDSFMQVLSKNKENVDLADYFGMFATDVIASTAFGIDTRAMEGNSQFREMGKNIFRPSLSTFVRFSLGPSLARKVGANPIPTAVQNYFTGIVKSALNHRKESGVVRSDFVQHMVTLQQKGYIEVAPEDAGDEILEMDVVPDLKVEMSDDLMVGQSMAFLVAGFDTTALAMSWFCYELSQNPDSQTKIRQEVKDVLAKHEGVMNYDSVREMKYLGYCMKESNRLHSVLSELVRKCSKPYTIPGTSYVVQPGDYVYIPSLAVHMDPAIFPDPYKFIPERWEPENKRPNCTYLPWGAGPRMCIAMRFANMEMTCTMANLITNYQISLHPSVELPIKRDPYGFFAFPIKRIKFNLRKIEK